MKDMYRLDLILFGFCYLVILFLITSCEQEDPVVEMNTAPGGGTVSTYKAYTISSVTEDDIYGRVVFYKDNSSYTLVQVSLYNTDGETGYTTALYEGTTEVESPEEIMSLYSVDGATGEFSPSKFYVINDKSFFDGLADFDAHIQIMSGDALVTAGNVGKNATPVAEAE